MSRSIEDAIFAVLAEREVGETIRPSNAARMAKSGEVAKGVTGPRLPKGGCG